MAIIDKIGVASGARDEKDQKLEPEEQPAAQLGTAPVAWRGAVPDFDRVNGGRPIPVQELRTTRAPLTRHVDAGALAIEQSIDCALCRHFDHATFFDRNPDRRRAVALLSSKLLVLKVALSTEAALQIAQSAGICHARQALVVPGLNGCLEFRAIDTEAARLMAKKRDDILHAAEGRHEGRIIVGGK